MIHNNKSYEYTEEESLDIEIMELDTALPGTDAKEVVVALSPAFGLQQKETIVGLPLSTVIREISAGLEEEGMKARYVKYYNTSDLSAFASDAAKLSGSGISIGIQSKGTTTIHQKDLAPLDNLELFPQAPLYSAEVYRQIGKNAAHYGKGQVPNPIPTMNDQMVLAKYQIKAALLHIKETELVISKKPAVDVAIYIQGERV